MSDRDFRKSWLLVLALTTALVFSLFTIFSVSALVGFLTHLDKPKKIKFVESSAHVSPASSTPRAAP